MSKENRDSRDLAEAKERAERAKRYAEMYPHFAKPDSVYCTVKWQLEQLSRFKECSAPQRV